MKLSTKLAALALVLAASFAAVAALAPDDTSWIVAGQPISSANLKANLDNLFSRVTATEAKQFTVTDVSNTCVGFGPANVCRTTCPANTVRTGCMAWTGGYQNPTECSPSANGCDCVISTGGVNNIAVVASCGSFR